MEACQASAAVDNSAPAKAISGDLRVQPAVRRDQRCRPPGGGGVVQACFEDDRNAYRWLRPLLQLPRVREIPPRLTRVPARTRDSDGAIVDSLLCFLPLSFRPCARVDRVADPPNGRATSLRPFRSAAKVVVDCGVGEHLRVSPPARELPADVLKFWRQLLQVLHQVFRFGIEEQRGKSRRRSANASSRACVSGGLDTFGSKPAALRGRRSARAPSRVLPHIRGPSFSRRLDRAARVLQKLATAGSRKQARPPPSPCSSEAVTARTDPSVSASRRCSLDRDQPRQRPVPPPGSAAVRPSLPE